MDMWFTGSVWNFLIAELLLGFLRKSIFPWIYLVTGTQITENISCIMKGYKQGVTITKNCKTLVGRFVQEVILCQT
jgi:hypothetical protein